MAHSNIKSGTRKQAQRLRRDPTDAEKKLWAGLRAMRDEGWHWRRQVPIGRYVADFACLSARLIVEADGSHHAESVRDARRDRWLASQGFTILRLWNNDILENLDGCFHVVSTALDDAEQRGLGHPSRRGPLLVPPPQGGRRPSSSSAVSVMSRIDQRFAELKKEGRPALVTFISAGDPDYETSLGILKALPGAGADVIELGMPFSDPMAEGPPIQRASERALRAGQTMVKTLAMVREFRKNDPTTPIVLMGYYNPIFIYGNERFLDDAKAAGADGLIVVDLPPEADEELCLPAMKRGVNFIRLATPTTDDKRLPAVLANTSGFVYYVSITGITGTASPDTSRVAEAVKRIKRHTDLPIAVGFGVKTAEQARIIGGTADGVVVGSALVNAIAGSLADGRATESTIPAVLDLTRELASGVRSARRSGESVNPRAEATI